MSATLLYGGVAALQIAGSMFAADNIERTAKLNKQISDMNAEFAELDAFDAEIEGFSEIAKYQSVVDQTLGEQRANLGAADVDINYGNVGDIQKETRFIAEINKMEIEKRAQEKSLGYKAEARSIRLGGVLDQAAAKTKAGATRLQGLISAASTGLTGYGS